MVYVIPQRCLAQIGTNVAQCSTIKKSTKFRKCGAIFTHVFLKQASTCSCAFRVLKYLKVPTCPLAQLAPLYPISFLEKIFNRFTLNDYYDFFLINFFIYLAQHLWLATRRFGNILLIYLIILAERRWQNIRQLTELTKRIKLYIILASPQE